MDNKNKTKIAFYQNAYSGPLYIVLATLIGAFFKYTEIPETNIAIMYLLAVVAISIFTQSYIISIRYSIRATLVFNYFFTAPYFAFEIDNISYIITFVIMVAVSLIITTLTQRIKTNATIANLRAEENSRLYKITNAISVAGSVPEIMTISVQNISEMCNTEAVLIYNNIIDNTYGQCRFVKGVYDDSFSDHIKNDVEFKSLIKSYENNSMLRKWKTAGRNGQTLALLSMPRIQASKIDVSVQRILIMIMENAVMTMERMAAAEKQNQLLQENEKERYRSNLLRAISHDLRTPLSGIMGTSEMIMRMTDKADDRYELAQEIIDDAEWLHSLMENILNLTRLEDNRNYIQKQPEAVEEIIAVVLERFEKRAPGRELKVSIPNEFMLVPMDAKLIIQVLINLLDNAVKNTKPEDEILLSVTRDGTNACFVVADRGRGILEKDLPYIFQLYYTSSQGSADSQKGMGLGLAFCSTVVKAHGGNITASNNPEGGAVFTFNLPMEDKSNE